MPAKKTTRVAQTAVIPHKPLSDWMRYIHAGVFAAVIFAATYGYTSWLKIPNVLNKSAADTAILLTGLSMMMSSLGYFFNVFDKQVAYRKHLGIVGFAFAIAHLLLSWGAFLGLLEVQTWQKGAMWPVFTGFLALTIFSIMALVSNQLSARLLGGKLWRNILRTGYIAVLFVAAHVVLLKYGRWVTWYQGGMKTLPSTSLIVTVFMAVVVVMRVALWWSIKQQRAKILKKK